MALPSSDCDGNGLPAWFGKRTVGQIFVVCAMDIDTTLKVKAVAHLFIQYSFITFYFILAGLLEKKVCLLFYIAMM